MVHRGPDRCRRTRRAHELAGFLDPDAERDLQLGRTPDAWSRPATGAAGPQSELLDVAETLVRQQLPTHLRGQVPGRVQQLGLHRRTTRRDLTHPRDAPDASATPDVSPTTCSVPRPDPGRRSSSPLPPARPCVRGPARVQDQTQWGRTAPHLPGARRPRREPHRCQGMRGRPIANPSGHRTHLPPRPARGTPVGERTAPGERTGSDGAAAARARSRAPAAHHLPRHSPDVVSSSLPPPDARLAHMFEQAQRRSGGTFATCQDFSDTSASRLR